jgi:hypothetical protein
MNPLTEIRWLDASDIRQSPKLDFFASTLETINKFVKPN